MSPRSAAAAAVLAFAMVLAPFRPAAAEPNPVTPGDFRGFGFDQCLAPTQRTMDVWLNHSPFLSVGIYISGNSRALPQPAEPDAAVDRHPAAQGLAAAADHPRPAGVMQRPVPALRRRPGDRRPSRSRRQVPVRPAPGPRRGREGGRRGQGARHRAAQHALVRPRGVRRQQLPVPRVRAGLPQRVDQQAARPRSTSPASTPAPAPGSRCSTTPGSSGPDAYTLPDMIWIARWDGVANTSTSYIRDDGWRPGGRVKQYEGGHNETWGGVTINIDRNYLDVGRGSFAAPEEHCGGVSLDFRRFPALREPGDGYAPPANKVRALQCLLQERGLLRRQAVGQVQRRDDRRGPGMAGEPRLPREHHLEPGRTGSARSPRAGTTRRRSAPPDCTCGGCSERSTRPTRRSSARSTASSTGRRPRTSAPTSAASASLPPASSTSAPGRGCGPGASRLGPRAVAVGAGAHPGAPGFSHRRPEGRPAARCR